MNIEILVGLAASTIISSLKDKAVKKKLRAVMLKIFTTIKTAYAGDKAFQ